MTHMHIAGAIHADASGKVLSGLTPPKDVNALEPKLFCETAFRNPDGVIVIGGLPITEIAEQVGTPVFVLDEQDVRAQARRWGESFAGWSIYYAGKAFLCAKLAHWIESEGLNLDVCSGGELTVALRSGFPEERIGLHGNNKSDDELRLALTSGVGRIIVDSANEIARLERLCMELNVTATVLIRVTTGVEAHTHEYIATAHEDQKFGFSINGGAALVAMVRCFSSPVIELRGIHSHIGSQIFDTHGFEVACRRTLKLIAQFKEATGVQLPELDLGGGFGIAYVATDTPATAEQLANNMREIVAHECRAFQLEMPDMSIEPGRAIVGPGGTAIYRVGTVKSVDVGGGLSRLYVSVDGGMSDNVRPALYGAEYTAVVGSRESNADPVLARVVGLHCEGGDILVRDVYLPGDVAPGDLIAVPGAVAYSRSMASNYNMTPRPPVVSVKDGLVDTMIRRETLEDLLALDAGL